MAARTVHIHRWTFTTFGRINVRMCLLTWYVWLINTHCAVSNIGRYP